MGIKILVCGGRNYYKYRAVSQALDQVERNKGIDAIVQGGDGGVDYLARKYASKMGKQVLTHKAFWDIYGEKAGSVRNQEMLDREEPDLVVVFPGGKDVEDVVERAQTDGYKIWRVEYGKKKV